ncbi:hypothetical protein IF1G_02378 [Cordyceps javanica]|uniref:Uncharacterized protein n=1 Tax=Cordyceps javanica TaxID=43265 RepID=A0A545W6I0_9HYPO|nr:hypothetical protein IF1G_02378 [Cordyceps javanica]TQW09518.1 hypothetical protein IF2G_02308 [Cordyceps javanica]
MASARIRFLTSFLSSSKSMVVGLDEPGSGRLSHSHESHCRMAASERTEPDSHLRIRRFGDGDSEHCIIVPSCVVAQYIRCSPGATAACRLCTRIPGAAFVIAVLNEFSIVSFSMTFF